MVRVRPVSGDTMEQSLIQVQDQGHPNATKGTKISDMHSVLSLLMKQTPEGREGTPGDAHVPWTTGTLWRCHVGDAGTRLHLDDSRPRGRPFS